MRVRFAYLSALLVLLFATMALNAPNPPTNLSAGGSTQSGDDSRYCSPSGLWTGSKTDGPASLPAQCMDTALSNTPSPGVVRGPYTTLASLQAAINASNCGDIIEVMAGTDLGIGTITLPQRTCDDQHWNMLLSTGYADPSFPQEGTRITPCQFGAATMPGRNYPCVQAKNLGFKIEAASGTSVLKGGDHWRIIGMEATRITSGGAAVYNVIDLSSSGAQVNHIVLDRIWCHGVPTAGFPATSQSADTSTTRCLYLGQSNHVAVINSYFTDFYDTASMSANGNTDAQCMAGGFGGIANSGWGIYKFVNNHCEASGEGILLGGANGPPLTPAGCTVTVNCNLDVPTDIEVRRNYFFKPLQWNGNTTTVATTGWPVGKNGFEMKIGARALFEGNVIENVWYSSQVGQCWLLAPKNQSSGGTSSHGTAPTALTNDFTYRYNYCYNTAGGIGLFQSMDLGCSGCEAQGADRVSVHDNIVGDDMNLGSLSSTAAGDAMEVYAARDSTGHGLNRLQNLSIANNTFVRAMRTLTIFGADSTGQMLNFTMQNNVWPYSNYGWGMIGNAGGCDQPYDYSNNAFGILNACVTNWVADHDAVFNWKGTAGANWPTDGKGAGNFFFTSAASVGFANYGTGDSGFNPQNYELTSSSLLHNAGSDGRDLGADIPQLTQAIAGVRE